jgi:hypothetical protein
MTELHCFRGRIIFHGASLLHCIHSFFDGHRGGFHVLTTVNGVSTNVEMLMSLGHNDFNSFEYMSSGGSIVAKVHSISSF